MADNPHEQEAGIIESGSFQYGNSFSSPFGEIHLSKEEAENIIIAGGAGAALYAGYKGYNLGQAVYRYTNPSKALSIDDPRERMANQLLRRGHASMDEILESSYGEWPPKGLDIISGHEQQVRFGNIIDRAHETPVKGIFGNMRGKLDVIKNIYGDAQIVGDRLIRMNDIRLSKIPALAGKSALSSTLGHEGVHILQGDNFARAGQIYGHAAGSVINGQMVSGANDSSLRVFNDHLDTSFTESLSQSQLNHFNYVKEGLETQARIHEITMDGYQRWGQLPANREELLVAMEDAGLDIPEPIMRELGNSPTIDQTRAVFSTNHNAMHPAARDLNFIQGGLTQEGKIAFWDDAMPRLYSDMIEMYGDGPGRARFGLGENPRAQLNLQNEMRSYTSVSEASWNHIQKGDIRGIEVNVEDLSPYQRAKIMVELEEAGIEGKIVSSSVQDNQKVIRVMGEENVSRIQQAVETGRIPHEIPDQLIGSQKWENVTNSQGEMARYLDTSSVSPEKLEDIQKGLQERGISFEIRQSSLNGGTEMLSVKGQDTLHIDNLKAISASQANKAMSLTGKFASAADNGISEMAKLARMGANTPALGIGIGVGAAALTHTAHSGQKDLAAEMKEAGILSEEAYNEYIVLSGKTEGLLQGDIGLSTIDPTGLSVIVTAGVEMKAYHDFKNWADEYAPHLTSEQFESLSMSLVAGDSARDEMLNRALDKLPGSIEGQPEMLHDLIEAKALRDELSFAPVANGGFDPGLFDEQAFNAANQSMKEELGNLMADPQGIDMILNAVPAEDRMDYVLRLAKSEPDQEALAQNHPEIAAYMQAHENSVTGWFMKEDDVLEDNPELLNAYIKERSGMETGSGTDPDPQGEDIQLASFNGADASYTGDPELLAEAHEAGLSFHHHFMENPELREQMKEPTPENTSSGLHV